MSRRPNARPGNRNAAIPPEKRRVPLSLRVAPETRSRLIALAKIHGSISRAVDALTSNSISPTE